MKKVVLSMFVFGLTSLGFSQETNDEISTVELEDVTVLSANVNYLTSVGGENTPKIVRELQVKAASYDVTANADFDKKRIEPFEVIFKAPNGDLLTYYNRKGEIISARESFKNVTLPMEVIKKAFQGNEGWALSGNQYASRYRNNDITKKVFKINLRNGNLKKSLVINVLKK